MEPSTLISLVAGCKQVNAGLFGGLLVMGLADKALLGLLQLSHQRRICFTPWLAASKD